LAIGAVYYYNTSTLFAEGPEVAIDRLDSTIHQYQESSSLPTVDAIVAEKRQRAEAEALKAKAAQFSQTPPPQATPTEHTSSFAEEQAEGSQDSVGDLEEEADQQGAFNPETGEINWDCPCLGGMAHGPCGPEFREAFSCFVYSKEEPKGMECIDKFKGMQDCFRRHPEMYGSELEDDEDELEDEIRAQEAGKSQSAPAETQTRAPEPAENTQEAEASHRDARSSQNPSTTGDEGGELIPKDMHDATSKN